MPSQKKKASQLLVPQQVQPHKIKAVPVVWLHLLILLVVFIAGYSAMFSEKIDLNGDNAYYHILGQALASGKGYVDISNPALPAHNHFPPGYPFIVSLFMRLGFGDIGFFSLLNSVFGFLGLAMFYCYLCKIGFGRSIAFVVCLFCTLNTGLLNYSGINMSEIPFLFFSVGSLLLLAHINNARSSRYRTLLYVLLLLCLVATYYIRSTGIALVLAIVAHLLLEKKWLRAGLLSAGFILSVLPWFLRSRRLGGNSYVHQLLLKNPYRAEEGAADAGDLLTRILDNLVRYITSEIPSALLSRPFEYKAPAPPQAWFAGLLLLGLMIAGLVRLWQLHRPAAIYIVLTGGVLLLWPEVWTGIRFLIPVIPFLFLLAVTGAFSIARALFKGKNLRWSPYLASIAGLFMITPISERAERADDPYPDHFRNYFSVAEWARDRLPDTVVICCRKPELFYLFSGHACVHSMPTSNDTLLLKQMKDNSVDYVVLDQLGFSSTPRYLYPALLKNAGRFQVVTRTKAPETFLLKFD